MNKILMGALLLIIGMLVIPNAAAISGLSDNLGDDTAGNVSTHKIGFNLENVEYGLPKDGIIVIKFNSSFDISAFTNDSAVYVCSYCEVPVELSGTYTWSKQGSSVIITRQSDGDMVPVGARINFTLGNITNPTIAREYTVDVITRTVLITQIEMGTAYVTIYGRPATKFTFDTIGTQVAGEPFTVTVTARDQFGNKDSDFSNESAVLSSTPGSIEPHIMNNINGFWSGGVWTGPNEKIEKAGPNTITATSGSVTGTSNQFTVNPGVLGSIVINDIASPKYDEVPFTVTARAYDSYGNFKSDYNGNDSLTITWNESDIRPISILPDYALFANGKYSGTVTVDVTDTEVPQPTYYDAGLEIWDGEIGNTSNPFNVSELPVDLVNSTVVAYPLIVPEDGTISTVTVTVKNGINQGIMAGVSVLLTSDKAYVTIDPSNEIVTDSTGRARFNVSSYTKGLANFTATVKGVYVLNQKATVYFGYDNMLHLAKDWNLVSVPRQLADSDINALSTTKVDRIYYYDAASSPKVWKYAIYDRVNDTWSGTLTTIDDGKGYWMFASAPDDVPIVLKPVEGGGMSPSYPLNAGWNMIGYTQKDLKPYLYTNEYIWPDLYYPSWMPVWDSMYEWTGSEYKAQYPWQVEIPPQGNDNPRVTITRGYWIFLQDDDTLVP